MPPPCLTFLSLRTRHSCCRPLCATPCYRPVLPRNNSTRSSTRDITINNDNNAKNQPAYHSKQNAVNAQVCCGCAILPLNTTVRGPAPPAQSGKWYKAAVFSHIMQQVNSVPVTAVVDDASEVRFQSRQVRGVACLFFVSVGAGGGRLVALHKVDTRAETRLTLWLIKHLQHAGTLQMKGKKLGLPGKGGVWRQFFFLSQQG